MQGMCYCSAPFFVLLFVLLCFILSGLLDYYLIDIIGVNVLLCLV